MFQIEVFFFASISVCSPNCHESLCFDLDYETLTPSLSLWERARVRESS